MDVGADRIGLNAVVSLNGDRGSGLRRGHVNTRPGQKGQERQKERQKSSGQQHAHMHRRPMPSVANAIG